MTIFFSTSFRGHKKHPTAIKSVYETLTSFKSLTIISPGWNNNYAPIIKATLKREKTGSRYEEYRAIRQAIRLSDACIFEVTHESFQVGHEVSFALAEKKPTLCLSRKENFAIRIENDYFYGKKYRNNTIKPSIQDFLAKVRETTLSKRFNLFLYPHQIKHLKTQGEIQGMNMSEYIRFLINADKLKS